MGTESSWSFQARENFCRLWVTNRVTPIGKWLTCRVTHQRYHWDALQDSVIITSCHIVSSHLPIRMEYRIPGLSDGGCMFLSWSTAWMGGVTLRGFTLCWDKKKKTHTQRARKKHAGKMRRKINSCDSACDIRLTHDLKWKKNSCHLFFYALNYELHHRNFPHNRSLRKKKNHI